MEREDLLRSAMQTFCTKGVKDLTERRIMYEFELPKDQFYRWFSDKEDFIKQALDLFLEEQKEVQSGLLARAQHPVAELMNVIRHHTAQLQNITPAFFIQIQYLYPRVWAVYVRHVQLHSYHLFYELLNKGIRHGIFRPDLNLEVVTKVLLEQINVLLNHNIFPPQRYNLAEVFRGIFLYYLKGISTEKGNKELENFFADFSL